MARMVLAEFGSREAMCIGLRWQAVHSSLSPNCRMECSERVEPFPVELTECGLPVFLNSPHLSAVVGNVLPRFCMVTPDFGFGGFLWVTLETSEVFFLLAPCLGVLPHREGHVTGIPGCWLP